MTDDLETELRRELHTRLVPFEAGRAEEMISVAARADLLAARRSWNAPLAAAAAVVVVGGSGAIVAAEHGGTSTPAAHRPARTNSAPTEITTRAAVAATAPPSTESDADSAAGTPIATIHVSAAPGRTEVTRGPHIPPGTKLELTAIIFSHADGHAHDTGTLAVRRDGQAVAIEPLQNFGTLDLPYGRNPPVFTAAHPLRVVLTCATATHATCEASVVYVGRSVPAS
jgi:hypothetical protein